MRRLLLLLLALTATGVGAEPHDPIRIEGDLSPADLILEDYGIRSGLGTMDDPFVISDWEFTAHNHTHIWIANSTQYYRLQDIRSTGGLGIRFDSVPSVDIERLDIDSTWISVWARDAHVRLADSTIRSLQSCGTFVDGSAVVERTRFEGCVGSPHAGATLHVANVRSFDLHDSYLRSTTGGIAIMAERDLLRVSDTVIEFGSDPEGYNMHGIDSYRGHVMLRNVSLRALDPAGDTHGVWTNGAKLDATGLVVEDAKFGVYAFANDAPNDIVVSDSRFSNVSTGLYCDWCQLSVTNVVSSGRGPGMELWESTRGTVSSSQFIGHKPAVWTDSTVSVTFDVSPGKVTGSGITFESAPVEHDAPFPAGAMLLVAWLCLRRRHSAQ